MNNGTIRVNRSEFQIYVSQAKAIPFHFQSTDLGMPFSIKRRFYIGYKTQIYQIKMFFPVFAISGLYLSFYLKIIGCPFTFMSMNRRCGIAILTDNDIGRYQVFQIRRTV